MIVLALAITVFTLTLCGVGYILYRLWHAVERLVRLHEKEEQQQLPMLYNDLSRQVGEIHQAMGGVVNNLKAVGHQVYNLNMLAGNALKDIQDAARNYQEEESVEDDLGELEGPRIMIELRHGSQKDAPQPEDAGQNRIMAPEDMPPEMYERFRAFQAIYAKIYTSDQPLPSRKRPDLN